MPDGDPAPTDGVLPATVDWERPMRAYVHVPFCATRCGYCDFNTYTPAELGGADVDGYLRAVKQEMDLAAQVGARGPVDSVFIGGGTPSLLSAAQVGAILDGLRQTLGIRPGAEVTMEANPEDVTKASLTGWLRAGVTRLSLGMQSADPAALVYLQRRHTPGAATRAARLAAESGFEHVSLDLIYGIPGQSDDSWRSTLGQALAAGPDHISAYALGVEPGTALHRQVRQGRAQGPDPDRTAAQYEVADQMLAEAGFDWYEISNWARPSGQCEHNLGYWRNDNWWGFGPGAHSHAGGVRWWNVKLPGEYRARLSEGMSPAAGREILDASAQHTESVMLQVRLAQGFTAPAQVAVPLIQEGLLRELPSGRLQLTRSGRMLADLVTRRLLGWDCSPTPRQPQGACATS